MTPTPRRLLLLLACVAAGVACLKDVDTDAVGYRCTEDADCNGLVCSAGRCAEDTFEAVLRLQGRAGDQVLTFESALSEALLSDGGYTSDGPVIQASSREVPDSVPVYQLRDPGNGDFLLTLNAREVESAERNYGFRSEGIAFHAYPPTSEQGSVSVYRLQRQGYHHYAVGTAERDEKAAEGWGVEFELLQALPP